MAWMLKLLFVATLAVGCLTNAAVPPTEPTILSDANNTTTNSNSTTTPTTTDSNSTTTTTNSNSTIDPTTTNSTSTTTTTNSTTTPATTVPPTTDLADPCLSQPCKGGSKCEPRFNQTVECVCLGGDYYDESTGTCSVAKVFPGKLSISSITYNDQLANKASSYFQESSKMIVDSMNKVFEEDVTDGYKESTVLEFRNETSSSTRSKGVIALVEMIFSANSDVKNETIVQKMEQAAAQDGPLKGATFTETSLCDGSRKPCDADTTKCTSESGIFNCTCLDGFFKTAYIERTCISCPSGKTPDLDEPGTCKDCPYGYSGFNCTESWQLILVIVGSLLGGLLLITIILLPIVAKKSSKKSSKKNKDKETGKSNMSQLSAAPAPMMKSGMAESRPVSAQGGAPNSLAAFANAGVPRIPRATANNGWDRGSNLEMTPSNSRQNLIAGGRNMQLDYTDDITGNVYSRPQSNPYAQSRPPFNPYGQSQGQSNPIFAGDIGRRY